MPLRDFPKRHIGPRESQVKEMLTTIGYDSLDALIDETVPSQIRLKKSLDLPTSRSEHWYLRELEVLAKKNDVYRSYIGMGYYNSAAGNSKERVGESGMVYSLHTLPK